MSVDLNAIVTQRVELTPELVVVRIVPDGWDLAHFEPGQFAVLGLPEASAKVIRDDHKIGFVIQEYDPSDADPSASPNGKPNKPDKMIKRAYSIASSSEAQDYLEFYIVLVTSGQLTPRLFALRPGDRVYLAPKFSGLFTLEEVPEHRNIILISTGTGLAPYMSMLRSQLVCQSPQRFAVLHGARHSSDLGYHDELSTLAHHCPNMSYLPTISRPKDEISAWHGEVGYIQDLWRRRVLQKDWGFDPSPENAHIFLCGTPGMIDEMTVELTNVDFKVHSRKNPGNLHIERYW